MDPEAPRREALALSAEKRAQITAEELDQLWFQEAARRADEIDSGIAKRIPAEDIRRQTQALLK